MARVSAEPHSVIMPTLGATKRQDELFLAALKPARRVVFVAHIQPDPDSLGSMLGLATLVAERLRVPTVLTQEGGIFRAENRAFVKLLQLDLLPVEQYTQQPGDMVVMVDSQPGTGRHSLTRFPGIHAVVDHHVTPGNLAGVLFYDIRPNLGATCTIVTNYLLDQRIPIPPKIATALHYGIETELSGYPREGTVEDDRALSALFSMADQEMLAQIRHARLPRSHFEVLSQAMANAMVHDHLIFTWVNPLAQPEQAAEVVDFLIRYENIDWAICAGVHGNKLILSARAVRANARAGERLREAVLGLGTAGGHERRAGGCIMLEDLTPEKLQTLREELVVRCRKAFGARTPQTEPLV